MSTEALTPLAYQYETFDELEKHLGDIKPASVKSIRELVGKGYDIFWTWKGRYRVLMGSRASKKTYTTAIWYIIHMMQMPLSNLLVVRTVADTNRDSTFATLVKIVHMLGVQNQWEWSKSPLEMKYKPTGQKIIFRGLDDPYKLSSIDVPIGVLCWAWFEEAYQIPSEDMFDKVNQSIRGKMPPGYFPQITLTFNPWNQGHWLKRRFFDAPRPGVLAMQTNYLVNEYLSEADHEFFEDMKRNNPRMYQVAGLGNWGVSEGLIYTDWEVRDFDLSEIKRRQSVRLVWGLDFGFSNDPNALIAAAVDTESKTIYVYHEWVKLRQTNHDTAEYLRSMGWDREQIICDSASPLNIAELVHENINALGTPKGRDSVENGIQLLQQYHIVILPRCINFRREISIYAYDQDKLGNILNKPVDADNHCFVKGTPVLTDKGQVPIEEVRVGDMVMTHKGFRKVLASGITRPMPARIWRMTFEDGRILEATEDHPMITTDGVKCFNTVTHHDTLISWDSEERHCAFKISSLRTVRIVSVEPTDRYEFVYDLTVEDAHTFFANGILVHNCMDAIRYAVTYMVFFTGGGFYGAISGEDLSDPRKAKEVEDRMKGTQYVYST